MGAVRAGRARATCGEALPPQVGPGPGRQAGPGDRLHPTLTSVCPGVSAADRTDSRAPTRGAVIAPTCRPQPDPAACGGAQARESPGHGGVGASGTYRGSAFTLMPASRCPHGYRPQPPRLAKAGAWARSGSFCLQRWCPFHWVGCRPGPSLLESACMRHARMEPLEPATRWGGPALRVEAHGTPQRAPACSSDTYD